MPSVRITGARFDALWQKAREPVFVLNRDLRLAFVNHAWEDLTGHPTESVLGLACRPHGPTGAGDLADLAGSFCPPDEALQGRPAGAPTLIVHASGERRWRRVEYWPYHEAGGQRLCIVGLVRDEEAPAHAPDSEAQRLRAELLEVRRGLQDRRGLEGLIGRGPAHRRLLEQVAAAALTRVPVLIAGEPGTGKRLVARSIHQDGPRGRDPLLPLDCGALPAEVLAQELFGPASRGVARAFGPPAARGLDGPADRGPGTPPRPPGAAGRRPRRPRPAAGDHHRRRRAGPGRGPPPPRLLLRADDPGRPAPAAPRAARRAPVLAQHFLSGRTIGAAASAAGSTPRRSRPCSPTTGPGTSASWPGSSSPPTSAATTTRSGRGPPAAIRGQLGAAYTPLPRP
jgi:PAS domain S-box-containing protein